MQTLIRHVTRCVIAGIIAILPIGGLVLTLVLAERSIAESWLADQGFYFPGLGLLAAAALVYLLGLVVTTFLGRWLWARIDALLRNLPGLGSLYKTLKQIFGYGEGEEGVFKRVVLVQSPLSNGREVGLVTNEISEEGESAKLLVFVPGSPNPTTGRLVLAEADAVQPLDIRVNDALKSLLSVGSTPLQRGEPVAAS
ncbi:MAG: DUF502 domain-containing protein [Planctomycetota bacterium]|jgi:uncharacterized membrane protein